MTFIRALPALDSTFGCLFLAGILSTALWGVACVQLYFYYEKYFKTDKWWLKLYIFLIWALDTVHQALLIQSLYVYFVKEFANLLYLTHPQGTLIDEVIFAVLVDAMVQLLFVVRAWHLSDGNYLLTGVLSTVVVAQLAVTTTYFGQVYHFTEAVQLLTVLNTARAMNALVVVADTFIAAALIYLLWSRRSGVRKTDSIIKRLVMYTISTGLVTGLWGIVGLVGAQVLPTSFIYMLVDLVMPKLYFNCMLDSLNARSSLRENLTGEAAGVSIRLHNLPSGSDDRSAESTSGIRKASSPSAIECRVDVGHDSEIQKRFDRNVSEPDIEAAIATS